MRTRNKNLFKKFFSVLLSLFLFNSFVLNNFVYGAIPIQMPPIPQNNAVATTNFEPNVAYISDSFTALQNKKTVFFIQDLHSNPSVQKNISKILKQLDKQYGIDYIYMEGLPAGKADTSKLKALKEYNVSDKLINKNIITGTEYYFLNNETNAQIYGLENWDKYLSNIKRAAQILQDQDYITQTYNAFKENLYSNISNIKKVEKYINFNLTDDKLLSKTNQPILKYTELHKYISLSDNISNLNKRKISEEHTLFINYLKNNLPVSTYREITLLSKKENLQEYYSVLYNYLNSNNEYQDKYKNLNKLLKYNLQKSQINIVSLISQQNKYFNDYLSSLTNDKFQQDMFVVKMTQVFKDFLTLSISDENYSFFTTNYQKYINLLPKYLSQDYNKYTDLLFYDIIFDYHEINKDRNIDFIKNISANLQNRENNGKATVIIAGGFHSSILENLKKENISYLLITPNIESSYNTDFYDEMILSSISSDKDIKTNALAPIREFLTATNLIPQETVTFFVDSLINALVDKEEISPKELKNIISTLANEKLVINFPLTIEITNSKFIVNVDGNKIVYRIENDKVIWQDISIKYGKKNSRDLGSKIIAEAKRKFNVFEATSLRLNKKSCYSSKWVSKREGTRRNFMFTVSMIFSYLRIKSWSYDLMMGFASLNKNKTTKTTIDFNKDFGDDVKKLKNFSSFKDKKLDIIIENGLNNYLSKEDLLKIVASAIDRLDSKPIDFKEGIFIGYLDKSTNLFEDHLNNGFIGVNSGILQIQDEDVKKVILHAGIVHELAHEFKGPLNSSEYSVFEERMMFCDMKFLIENLLQIEYGKNADFRNILYSDKDGGKKYDHIIQRITSALTTPIQEELTQKKVPLFTKDVRFIRKFNNYKSNIEDISSFIKRKNFSIKERRGQLQHIEKEYLEGKEDAQQKLFSNLAISEEKEDSMQDFLKKHISEERREEVNNSLNDLITKFRGAISSDLDSQIIDQKVKEFEQYINDCLNLMYKRMPDYLFGVYYNEQGVIADHALNHSIEVLTNVCQNILTERINEIINNKIDIRALVYAAFLHDISCTLIRLNHEQNSTTFARAILKNGELSEEEIDKICDICFAHKKVDFEVATTKLTETITTSKVDKNKKDLIIKDDPSKQKKMSEEEKKKYQEIYNNIPESRILRDADALSAALALDRILGVWLTTGETFFDKNITMEERLRLIKENKFAGGDAINDLLRQFLRREEKYYTTTEAGNMIQPRKRNSELLDFLRNDSIKGKIKNAGMGITDKDIDDAIKVTEEVLNMTNPEPTETKKEIKQDSKFFGIKEKYQLLKQILKNDLQDKNIVLSDIHGGYARFAELVLNLLIPQFDKTDKTDDEINDIIINQLNHTNKDTTFYLLGDLLDRGNRQVETFDLVKRISETGKMKYVVGNHDLYAFMNILGLHLPFYKNYKGIPQGYMDFEDRDIRRILEILQTGEKTFLAPFGLREGDPVSKSFWAKKFDEYMQYAEEIQEKWTKDKNENGLTKEEELQNLFEQTFGFKLDAKGKDVLNNPEGIFKANNEKSEELLRFHKKFFGRNVGIAVYTGIRGVNKMSINWWLDRKGELDSLKDNYPQYMEYWQKMSDVVNDIISQQKNKYTKEVDTDNNIAWAIIDAIMYRNYESTEWNALDWVYHKNWGGGEKGFISQLNNNLEKQGKTKVDKINYFDNTVVKDLLKFYHDNFYLYRFDNYGICYMHSLLPVDEDGDVALGYVDEKGIFHDTDKEKRIKGFIYKGIHYKGKNVFRGLNKIAEDIRNFDLETNELSEITEALSLLTAIYADNTTKVKPANLREMKSKFGFNKILKKKGITTVVVGHNPVTKLDNQFEYATVRFFNKEFKIINVVQIDGNMSPEYAPPKGAGLARIINEGINTRGYLSGQSTEITSSATPDVEKEVFINSIFLNVFPILKDILKFTEKIYDKYSLLKQKLSFGSIRINKKNTTVIDLLQTFDDIKDVAEKEHIRGIKNIVVVPDEILKDSSFKDTDNKQTIKENLDIEGVPVMMETIVRKIKVARGYIPIISYSYEYDKENSAIDEQIIQNKIKEHIIDQINRKAFDIKTTRNMFVNNSVNEIFSSASLSKPLKNIFGPVLYDTRTKKSVNIVENLTDHINIDRVKDILSAA